MSGRGKRQKAIEGAVTSGQQEKVNPQMVVAILLSLIECGRVPTIRRSGEGEAIQTATASPRVKFTLPWTGSGNSLSIPQGQSLVYLSRDPTNCMMYYDYNNGGAAGVAQQAVYNWTSSFSSGTGNNFTFTVGNNQEYNIRPCWAYYASGKPFHGFRLFSRTFGDRTYVQCDAPPANNDNSISKLVFTANDNAGLKVGDVFNVSLYRLAEGVDQLIATGEFTVAVAGTGGNVTLAIPYTDKYRLTCNFSSLDDSLLSTTISVTQTWSCGTLCCNPLPKLDTIWQNLNRLRILGANVDVINQTPNQFRGGNVVATQFAAGTSEYVVLQGVDPYAYVSGIRGVESRDFAKGNFSVLKPDGDTAFDWRKPFYFDGSGSIVFARGEAFIKNGFVAIAISAPDLVTGNTTTTTRGQVTLDFGFSVEIDSQYDWLEFNASRANDLEWERAEEIMAQFPAHWDDPDWGKIFSVIKSGVRIGANILNVIPHPTAQAIGRGTNKIVDVLNAL